MNAQEIQHYLGLLGAELDQRGVTGEIVLVGGAIMLLALSLWLDVPGLRKYTAAPEYVLAMKTAAGRPEDVPDIQAPAAHPGLTHRMRPPVALAV